MFNFRPWQGDFIDKQTISNWAYNMLLYKTVILLLQLVYYNIAVVIYAT